MRQLVRRLGPYPTPDQRLELERKRQRLAGRVREFHSQSSQLLGADRVASLASGPCPLSQNDGYISDEELPNAPRPNDLQIENSMIVFPSSINNLTGSQAQDLWTRELKLRRAHANNALRGVRESLGHLSFQYVTKVRHASTNQQHLRSYQGVKFLNETLSFHQRRYNECRSSILRLDGSLADQYPYLKREDCIVSKMIAELNAPGQSNAKLAWFWTAGNGYKKTNDKKTDVGHMLECKSISEIITSIVHMNTVTRIHWLRARAQYLQWSEELLLTEHEMLWTTRYFMYREQQWNNRFAREMLGGCSGRAAYCEKQIALWQEFGRTADNQFNAVCRTYTPCWKPSVPNGPT